MMIWLIDLNWIIKKGVGVISFFFVFGDVVGRRNYKREFLVG